MAIPRRPEQKYIDVLIAPWMREVAEERGIDVEAVTMHGFPSVVGDSYEVRLFVAGEEVARKNFYVDYNGMHEVDPRKK